MTRRIILILSTLLLCCIPAAVGQVVLPDDETDEADELQQERPEAEVPREPMAPLDSLRVVVDSLLNEDNYTQAKTSTMTVKRGRKRIKVPYTTYVRRSFSVGCCIYDLTADTMLYVKNPDKMMTPASTQKLYVAAAMVNSRGRSFTFNTNVYCDGLEKIDSLGRKFLDGDIYVSTSCDPSLGKSATGQILKDIQGTLDIDSINGKIAQCITPKTSRVKLHEDELASMIVKALKQDSILLLNPSAGTAGRPAHRMWCMARLRTPLDDILERMLRSSDNTYAECVLLNLRDDDENWTYSDCKDVVVRMVNHIYRKYNHEKRDLSSTYYNIHDGSGLSFANKTTARSQVDLLRFIDSDKRIFNTIYPHLPRAGETGTLSRRMTSGPAHDNVRAKTGTLRGTITLSGYLTAANGHRIAFSILVNDCPDKSFSRGLQDKICQFMAGLDY